MVLKELLFSRFYFGGVVVLKELIYNSFYCGGCSGLERTDLQQFLLCEGVMVLK